MKKLFSLLSVTSLVMLCFLNVSCSDDDSTDDNGTLKTDTVKNNRNEILVTGGIESAELGYAEKNYYNTTNKYYSDKFTVTIYGYANLLDEMKPLLGLGLNLGIEIADNKNFTNAEKIKASALDNDNKFRITAGYKEQQTIYWRAYMETGDFEQYGKTLSYTLPSVASVVEKMSIETGELTYTEYYSASVSTTEYNDFWSEAGLVGIAYSYEKSALSVGNIENCLDYDTWVEGSYFDYQYQNYEYSMTWDKYHVVLAKATNQKSISLISLKPGTKFYYCQYIFIPTSTGKRVVAGDIKEFTTKGESAEELARYVTTTISSDDKNETWNVRISTSLANKFPGKEIKYGVNSSIASDYESSEPITIEYLRGGTVYATGSGSNYKASVSYPRYLGMYTGKGYNIHWIDGGYYAAEEVAENLLEKIKTGEATDDEMAQYAKLMGILYDGTTQNEAAHQTLQYSVSVFVEIDNIRYVVDSKRTPYNKTYFYWLLLAI